MKNNMKTKSNLTPHAACGTPTGVPCDYEVLLSESRPQTLIDEFPEHTITLARSTSADRIFFTTEEARKATELAIRNGQTPFIEVSPDIPAIELIKHAAGWPFDQGAHSTVIFAGLAEVASADVPVQLYGGNFYQSATLDDGVTVLHEGPLKLVRSVLFDEQLQVGVLPSDRVIAHTSNPHSLFHILVVWLCHQAAAEGLWKELRSGGETLLTPNGVVKGMALLPRPADPPATMFVYGFEHLPEADVIALKQLGMQKLSSGIWSKPKWTASDEQRLVTHFGLAVE